MLSSSTFQRRATREVRVGNVGIGGTNPVRVQSMLTCDTMDTATCIRQTLDLAEAGCEIVRITAPTVKDAANLQHIAAGLRARGCGIPLVADIHFKPEAALEAAKWVEKIRINPGNYADSKKFKVVDYTDAEYAAELDRIRERFSPLVQFCKERGVAMRIGTNHGSLSDRIMNRYGDSPLGMVESALEFAQIARGLGYHALVFSMKASNVKVMIEAYRLLAARLDAQGPDWNYPLHLGVTEAGDGEDGRIKSAIGIGSLLCDGLGDTIRVSLTEESVREIPVAYAILQAAGCRVTKPEYIMCPSCGRTLYDIQETASRIKAATGHLKGVKIAVMGCIVNGPGEMADADFGYVGGAPGKINLYVGKTPVKFNLPQAEAVDRLVDLIREHGKWVEPGA
ncbi:MAG: (E)-4-hydroxy-3-methylbut-2-enyl-diphosphate synthase [Chthoniobacteraceae bacterium]|nr:(E)-4-hydroxy-3-methylbut-2-enyl-diphosphate synthase [Chthoniobacteraceae bacterium]